MSMKSDLIETQKEGLIKLLYNQYPEYREFTSIAVENTSKELHEKFRKITFDELNSKLELSSNNYENTYNYFNPLKVVSERNTFFWISIFKEGYPFYSLYSSYLNDKLNHLKELINTITSKLGDNKAIKIPLSETTKKLTGNKSSEKSKMPKTIASIVAFLLLFYFIPFAESGFIVYLLILFGFPYLIYHLY